jgi:hypothetical protein
MRYATPNKRGTDSLAVSARTFSPTRGPAGGDGYRHLSLESVDKAYQDAVQTVGI